MAIFRGGDLNLDASLHFMMRATREAGSYIGFHAHNGLELVYYASGSGTTQIDKTKYGYEAGHFTVTQPNSKHDEFRKTETDVLFLVCFHDNKRIPLRNGLYPDAADGRIGQLFEAMAEELYGKLSHYQLKLRSLLTETIVEISRLTGAPAPAATEPADRILDYSRNYIEQYYGTRLDLPGLARSLGYSYDHFRHMFKSYTGYSPMQFIVQRRISEAKRMLTQDEKALTTIAINCGFSNSAQFSMMFKKEVGMPPKRYREMYADF
ncbi:helix-turn-helix transcriptional regulator [Paenibacillus koleovorans]|uniref:helix-turn-helix transcriptional regulator n=1 Tax=Paenibacillus koleovorans TaxID=121608 RepID=UPI000FD7C4C3|nr:AraC family transcriptional regulator [Paenibacillus koleovorans]